MHKSWFSTGAVVALGFAAPLSAELNVPIAARVVSFLQPPPSGTIAAAILFDPGNAASEAEASAIERSIGSGLAAGRSAIHARRLPIGAMGSLTGYNIAFVTTGLRAEQGGIAAAAAKSSVLTISSDPSCVQASRCVVGITSTPKTQITVNRAAARAANIRFGSAFLMLVKEI
ncbi:YfiR/HmsC family protein [Sphingomonas sp. CARO-RG-8B-R24-01]|uniref:YfiR/HmsC family protein n=1 Tax=Sphingomonas sp. CARO-RG-8B-R24-01 TaxID=2914831 RepID=UPI001F55BBF9